jgi:hypothetical protein
MQTQHYNFFLIVTKFLLEAMCEGNTTGIKGSWIRLALSTIFLFGSEILLGSIDRDG